MRYLSLFIDAYSKFVGHGASLCDVLPGEIQEAAARGWDSGLMRKMEDELRVYFRAVAKLSTGLSFLAFLPLPIAIIFLVQHKSYQAFNTGCVVWVSIIGLLAIRLIWPVIGIARILREAPESFYKRMMRSTWLNIDLLNILINVGLFYYLAASCL